MHDPTQSDDTATIVWDTVPVRGATTTTVRDTVPVRGGQGRTDEEVSDAGLAILILIIGGIAFAAGLLLGWVTTGGA